MNEILIYQLIQWQHVPGTGEARTYLFAFCLQDGETVFGIGDKDYIPFKKNKDYKLCQEPSESDRGKGMIPQEMVPSKQCRPAVLSVFFESAPNKVVRINEESYTVSYERDTEPVGTER